MQHLRLKTESNGNILLCDIWLQWQSRLSGVIANLVEHDNWRWKRSLLTFLVRDIHFKQQAELSFTKDTGALTGINRQRYSANDLNFDSGKKFITGLTYNKQLTNRQQDIFYTWWSCRLQSKSLHRRKIGYREKNLSDRFSQRKNGTMMYTCYSSFLSSICVVDFIRPRWENVFLIFCQLYLCRITYTKTAIFTLVAKYVFGCSRSVNMIYSIWQYMSCSKIISNHSSVRNGFRWPSW